MLTLKIVSPERIVFTGEVESVLVPGTVGQFEILNDHAPIISTLAEGKVVYSVKGTKKELQIAGGFVEVKKNEVSLCVEI
ncbi:ATP synthase F1 subunit epsilon [Prevotella multiformis]|uniref:ATP synthase F1 subunit epsilon n=1 Tax=Prevotella multiformis TaxID=282402 RepID=UPI0028DB08B9|nr:ATP synthase F1 subunit epsilon [Prevotella multiformis]